MSIIIKGDNNGIAVDGDLKIEHLAFSFGKGVTTVEGIHQVNCDDNIVDAEVVEYADAQEDLYPEIVDEAKSFFEKTYMSEETDKNGKRIKKNFPVEDVLHTIYNETKEWDPSDKKSTRKWKVLYELLRRKKFFKYEERHRYSHYVKGIVRYCFPDAKDSYGNNISKCDLDDSIEKWNKEDKELYFFLKDRMPK